MQFNIPSFVRFIIAGLMFLAFFVGMIQWLWLDPVIMFSKILAYLVVAIWAMMIGGVCYGLLPTNKTIQTTATALKKSGKKDRVIGYWLWLGCFVLLFCGALALYINEL